MSAGSDRSESVAFLVESHLPTAASVSRDYCGGERGGAVAGSVYCCSGSGLF